MFWLIISLIIIIPVVEMWGFMIIGSWMGVIPTILLVIFTGILGGFLAKREGFRAYQLAVIQFRNRQIPASSILDGMIILLGGMLLLIPGFFTDIVGFILLIPYSRGIVKLLLLRWLTKKIKRGPFIKLRKF